jgi:uncharacterized damage-inducible protein DinB
MRLESSSDWIPAFAGSPKDSAPRPRITRSKECPRHLETLRCIFCVYMADSPMRNGIVQILDDTFGRRNWGHQGLLAAAHGLTVAEASWKPPELAHTIWQQLNHIAYWRRNILERVRGRHPRWNQAWPGGGRTTAELRRTIRDLTTLHEQLRAAVLRLDPANLLTHMGSRYSLAQLLLGEAAHMSYHIGQIALSRRLYQRSHGRRPGRA